MKRNFELIKLEAKRLIHSHPGNELFVAALIDGMDENASWRDKVVEYKDELCDIIDQWDIRCIEKLRDAMPFIFPKTMRTGTLSVYMNDNLDWMIEKS